MIWPIIPVLGLSLLWKYFRKKQSPDSTTKSIVILGCSGSGKTHLWQKLQGMEFERIDKATGSPEYVESFDLGKNANGIVVKVKTTKDIPGLPGFVGEYYDKLIENDTFIYYLINLTRIEAEKDDNQARLCKIESVIREKKNAKLKLIGTHFGDFEGNKNDAIGAIDEIARDSISTFCNIQIVELKNISDLEDIKSEILKSTENG